MRKPAKPVLSVAITLAVCVLLFSSPAAATQAVQVTVSTTPASVAPGNNGYVTVSISNSGSENIDKLKVFLGGSDPQLIFAPFTTEMGALGSGKSTTAVASFSVPSDAPSGFYTATFRVDACYSGVCTSYSQVALVSVQSQTTLQVSSISPDRFSMGSSMTLNFTLSNMGDTQITNALLTWSASGMVLPQGTSNRVVIPVLPPKRDTVLSVPVLVNPAATPGVYSLIAYLQYTDQTGTQQSTNSSVGFTIDGFYSWIVTLESQDVIPSGGGGTATIRISNAGNQEAMYLISRLESDSMTVSPAESYIGSIKADDWDTQKITLTVPGIATGEYPVRINLAWRDAFGKSYTESHIVNVRISPMSLGSLPIALFVLAIFAVVGWYLIKKKNLLQRLDLKKIKI